MDLNGWEERYRAEGDSKAELTSVPTPLVIEAAAGLTPGRVLDLACGTGRNTLWLAERGWSVTALDGSPSAIDILRRKAGQAGLTVDAHVADFESAGFTIAPASWELITICYYLERKLFEPCKRGVVPGGRMIAIALLVEPGKENSAFRLSPGELRGYFKGWEILHDREGRDIWQHKVAEIVVRRPVAPMRNSHA